MVFNDKEKKASSIKQEKAFRRGWDLTFLKKDSSLAYGRGDYGS